jgi:hypothetical protein
MAVSLRNLVIDHIVIRKELTSEALFWRGVV